MNGKIKEKVKKHNWLKAFLIFIALLVPAIFAAVFLYNNYKISIVSAEQINKLNDDLDTLISDLDSNLPDSTINTTQTKLDDCSDLNGIKNVPNKNMLPILYYHHIGNNYNPANNPNDVNEVETANFEQQMKYLSDNGYKTIDVPTWRYYFNCGIPAPEKTVVLTFDDGYEDFYTDAFPILQKYNLASEVFIPSGLIDSSKYYMSLKQLKEIFATGLVTIGDHTITHPYLTKIGLDDVNKEVAQSKKFLEDNLGVKVNDFAYPFGYFNDNVVNLVMSANYQTAFTIDYKRSVWKDDMFRIPRIRVSHTSSLNDFIQMLN